MLKNKMKNLLIPTEGTICNFNNVCIFQGSNFTFRPGDTIGIIPSNKSSEVDTIIDHLNLKSQAELQYSLSVNNSPKGGKIPPHIPTKSTVRHVLTYCCDIRSVLKKVFFLNYYVYIFLYH